MTVVVQDTRQSKIIGTRGGIYPDSSALTLTEQSFPAIRLQVEQALRQLGFVVVDQNTIFRRACCPGTWPSMTRCSISLRRIQIPDMPTKKPDARSGFSL